MYSPWWPFESSGLSDGPRKTLHESTRWVSGQQRPRSIDLRWHCLSPTEIQGDHRVMVTTGHEDWSWGLGKTLGAGDWSQVQLENSWGGRDGSCLVEILATDINCYHLKRNLWLCTWRLDVLNNGENQDMSFPYVREFHKCRLGWYRVFLPLGATPSYHPLKKMDFPSRLDHDDGNSHSFSAFLGPSGASAAFVGGFPAITTSQLTGWQPVHQPMWQEIRFYIGWVP